jgi:glycosyltransferase involved in cell wall biosynthesis
VIEVYYSPDYSQSNPYQRLLGEALEAEGVAVTPVRRHDVFMPVAAADGGLPDVLHLHWIDTFVVGRHWSITLAKGLVFLVQLTVLSLVGVRLVWTVHNVLQHDPRTPRTETVVRHLLARLVDGMIVHCRGATETVVRAYHLPDRYRGRMHVVPHGHYLDAYDDDVSRETARDDLGLDSDDEFVFLFFGRICAYKNVPALVEAFRGLAGETLRLFVVGNPQEPDVGRAVREAAAGDERVRLDLEFIPTERIQVYMNAADVVVIPFEDVLTSGSAIAAMSFGRAVLVPNAGCVRTVFPPDGGFTYEPSGSVDTLRAAMRDAQRADVEAVGRANRRAVSSYDWETIARRTVEAYDRSTPRRDGRAARL